MLEIEPFNDVLERTYQDKPLQHSLTAVAQLQSQAATVVEYVSRGWVVVLSDKHQTDSALLEAVVDKLVQGGLHCTLLGVESSSDRETISVTHYNRSKTVLEKSFLCSDLRLVGYLGRFQFTFSTPKGSFGLQDLLTSEATVDLVVDLSDREFFIAQLPPQGYTKLAAYSDAVLDRVCEMVGEFEKPKYFNYDPEICAHSRSGITACTQCINVCPANAISTLGNGIHVDPYLCQGAGSCASACPTGAIRYTYPSLEDQLLRVHTALEAYRRHGGENPRLIFYDTEVGQETLNKVVGHWPENMIPLEIEELGVVGMDVCLAALAYGAVQVVLLATPHTAASVLKELDNQLLIMGTLLHSLGYSDDSVLQYKMDESGWAALCAAEPENKALNPAEFFSSNSKREVLHRALDHLYQNATTPRPLVSLPIGSPFGEVWLDKNRCTFCMACVWQCPGNALIAASDHPVIKFVEADCVQCGLCARTCPEDAIGPSPRYLFDRAQRESKRILNEEEPFLCIKCGKAFASQRIIEQMTLKLKQHAMFQGQALQRLKMCEDCRVKDMFEEELGMSREVP
ncbi:MAG: 4Fe-4S binding protein [Gammaproteobacteria bacterium]|nr:4Fe-4S binding protein [Gammaproteobacteria bacterium]MDH5800404.1 4Fe-4S binding protein [Gammaproteobacteria bacterium]